MTHRLLVSLILPVVMFAATSPLRAQAPAGPSTSPAATPTAPVAQGSDSSPAATSSPAQPSAPTAAPAASPAPTPASAETIKKARVAGFHPETKNGATVFCQETANLGTRFPTKKCMSEQQLQSVIDVQNQTHDSLRKSSLLDPVR